MGVSGDRRRDALVISGLVLAVNLAPLLAAATSIRHGRGRDLPVSEAWHPDRTAIEAHRSHAGRGVARTACLRGGGAEAAADNARAGSGGLEEAKLRKGAAAGDLVAIAKGLKNGANVRCWDTWWQTALHHAAQKGHAEAVHLLLQAGADVDAQDYLGRTALVLAAMRGCTDTLSLLLRGGADVTLASTSPWPNNNGRTALHWACYYGHPAAVALLCSHVVAEEVREAGTEGGREGGREEASRQSEVGSKRESEGAKDGSWVLEIKDAMDRSALHWAARRGHAACVEVLLYYGAETEGKDKKGARPVKLAEVHKQRDCAALLQRVLAGQGRPKHLLPAAAPSKGMYMYLKGM